MNKEATIQTPFGKVTAGWADAALVKITLGPYVAHEGEAEVISGPLPAGTESDIEGLLAYFTNEENSLPEIECVPEGTSFQRSVWEATLEVPYGQTASYGQLAERIGQDTTASRAVGMALNQNPLPLIVPCHRIVSATGDLTGFASGLKWKCALLGLEMPQYSLAL
jgi:methylated-DNA-[protein]-cysteine S-methyltransferase